MTAKLLKFNGFARVAAAPFARANEYSRGAAGASFSRAADTRHIPRLRAPLECRWQIDPATGALQARWVDPATDRGAHASVDDNIQPWPCRRQPLNVAGDSAAARLAA
jgi:hypothetical protein